MSLGNAHDTPTHLVKMLPHESHTQYLFSSEYAFQYNRTFEVLSLHYYVCRLHVCMYNTVYSNTMIRYLIILCNRAGNDCSSSFTAEMADSSSFTTGDTFECSIVENCLSYNEIINHITESTGHSSFTDYEICCGKSGSGSSLNCSSADFASLIPHWNSSGNYFTARGVGCRSAIAGSNSDSINFAGSCSASNSISKNFGGYSHVFGVNGFTLRRHYDGYIAGRCTVNSVITIRYGGKHIVTGMSGCTRTIARRYDGNDGIG